MDRTTIGLAFCLALGLVGGCAQPADSIGQPDPARPTGTPAVQPRWTSCDAAAPDAGGTPEVPAGNDALDLPRLGDGFVPAAAVVCAVGPERRADGGTDAVATESRADDIADLAAALRLPDQPRTEDSCLMDLPIVPWFALLDGRGRWIRPGVPVDACGKPRVEVRKALWALSLTRVSTRSEREIESAGAAAAGCPQGWADMVWVETSQAGRTWAATLGIPIGGTSRAGLCVYRVPADQRRTGKPAGEFDSGGPVPAARWTAIVAEVRAAAPAVPCTEPAGRFALLRAVAAADGTAPGGEIYVELDGCERIMVVTNTGPPALRQATPRLLTLLAHP